MKLILNGLILFLLGCHGLPPRNVRVVDPALEPTVSNLEQLFHFKITYAVKFSKLNGTTIGLCTYNGILVDKDYFDNSSSEVIEGLLLHEIGHCSFSLRHNDTKIPNDPTLPADLQRCPVTIMMSDINEFCYINNRTYYLNEFGSEIGIGPVQ